MPNVCQICNHSERLQIDRELVSGRSKASIAREYGVSECSLASHAANHLSRQLVTAYETRSMSENMDLMNRIDRMIDNAETIFQRNFDKKKDYLALQALNSQKGIIELLAKISAFLHQSRAMELETSVREESEEMKEAVGKLELCELELLGKIQDKLAGTIPWRRLLPPEFYQEEEKDFIHVNVDVPKDADIEPERIVVRPEIEGGSISVKTDSLIEGFVEGIDAVMDEAEELIDPVKDPVQDDPAKMTRGTSPKFDKITYGPGMPEAAKRRAAKEYVRNHGRMPRESWLRDALD